MTYDGVSHHFTYDAEGNQLQVDSGQTATFVFDALNHSVSQTIGGQVTESVYDISGRLSSAWSSHTASSESHIFADGIQIAFRSGDGKTYFKHTNWLKTDRVHTDLNGAVAATFTSLPWGDGGSVNSSESYGSWDGDRFADLDDNYEDGTYHAQYRFYSPAQGHWMSPDPYDGSYDPTNPQSLNRYAYALNNPLSYVDPTGLAVVEVPCTPAQIQAGITTCYGVSVNGNPYDPGCIPIIGPQGQYLGTSCTAGSLPPGSGGNQGNPGSSGGGGTAPSKVGCGTVLPNGQTLGQYINQGRAQLQAVIDNQNALAAAGGDVNPFALTATFASIASPYGQIDFKNGTAGTSVLATNLGLAGNFAYYAIGSGYFSPTTLDIGASVYSHGAALLGRKPFSSLTGPLGIDASAASVRNAALATPGCPG